MILRKLIPAAAIVTVLAAPGVASAAEYVCTVDLVFAAGAKGDDGFIDVSLHDQPNCQGSYTRGFSFCSNNPGTETCAVDPNLWLDRTGLIAIAESLRAAAIQGQQVAFNTTTCVFYELNNCAGGLKVWGT